MNNISKKKMNNINCTLDIQHTKYIEKLNKANEEINEYKSLIDDIETLLKITTDPKEIINLNDKHNEYLDIIANIKKKNDDLSYYTNTSDILFKYYDIVEKGNGQVECQIPDNSILSYFKCPTEPTLPNLEINKQDLLSKYINIVDDNHVPIIEKNKDKCEHCGSEDIIVMSIEGYMYCLSCNNMEFVIIDNDKPYYKDPPKEVTYFSYKRINHFNVGVKQWAKSVLPASTLYSI